MPGTERAVRSSGRPRTRPWLGPELQSEFADQQPANAGPPGARIDTPRIDTLPEERWKRADAGRAGEAAHLLGSDACFVAGAFARQVRPQPVPPRLPSALRAASLRLAPPLPGRARARSARSARAAPPPRAGSRRRPRATLGRRQTHLRPATASLQQHPRPARRPRLLLPRRRQPAAAAAAPCPPPPPRACCPLDGTR